MAHISIHLKSDREPRFCIRHCEAISGGDDYDTLAFSGDGDALTVFLSREGTQEVADLLNGFLADERIREAQEQLAETEEDR